MDNLATRFIGEWPKDANGRLDCAWLRVKFENLPMNDARNVGFILGNTSSIEKIEDRLESAESEIWLFVTPTENTYLEAQLDKYGMSNRLSNLKFDPKHVYDVVLRNDKTVSIIVITKPEGAIASLETGQRSTTPATLTDVTLGKHTLTISLNGKTMVADEIEVTEDNVRFDEYDFREKKNVTFKSDPSHAILYVDGEEKGMTPVTLELPYDSYNIEAKLSDTETDTRSITVDELSETEITLEPIKKKTFEVYATYNGNKVNADLYIDGRQEGEGEPSYTLSKPIGKKYEMNMIYYGNSKKRTIKVRENMPVEQEFKISARNSFVWPWQREYEASPIGFSMGYVSKQWVTRGEGEQLKENVWGDEGKSLHGLQVGLHFQPCFSWGLGLYSGIFYECYLSWSDEMRENGYMDQFVEHCAYMPVHLYYRFPFAKKVSLSIHGGIGMDCGIHASFSSTEYEDSEPVTDYYGESAWPKRFNFSGEIGVGLRLGPVQINAQYSKGLTNHKFYTGLGDYKTIQNKLNFSISTAL